MHTHTPHHHSPLGMRWNAANAAITILFMLLFLILLFMFLTLTAQPAQGQNSIPPTAREAATMPQFAWRLAHPALSHGAVWLITP